MRSGGVTRSTLRRIARGGRVSRWRRQNDADALVRLRAELAFLESAHSKESMRVFVSYAGEDQESAQRVVAILKSLGCESFFARSTIAEGENISARISRGLKDADLVLVLWSKAASQSRYVEDEWGAAHMRSRDGAPLRLVFALLDGTPVPEVVRADKHLDLRGQGWDAKLKSIIGRAVPERDAGDSADADEPVIAVASPDKPRIKRQPELDQAYARVSSGETLVVLAPIRGGRQTFVKHLQERLRREHPNWHVPDLSVRPKPRESEEDYIERMTASMQLDKEWDRIVVCTYSWSKELTEREGAGGRSSHRDRTRKQSTDRGCCGWLPALRVALQARRSVVLQHRGRTETAGHDAAADSGDHGGISSGDLGRGRCEGRGAGDRRASVSRMARHRRVGR